MVCRATKRPSLARLALILSALRRCTGAADEAAPHGCQPCPVEPLRVLEGGKFTPVNRSGHMEPTTCGEFTNGCCPYAVPFPGFSCLVNCIAKAEDCTGYNNEMTGVNPYENHWQCASCNISGCGSCTFSEDGGPASCIECLDGFVLTAGRVKSCKLWNEKSVIILSIAISGVLAFVIALTFLGTCWGAIAVSLHMHGHYHGNRYMFSRLRRVLRLSSFANDDKLRDPLMRGANAFNAESSAHAIKDQNMDAIHAGLKFSLVSSIKFSHMLSKAQAMNADSLFTANSSLRFRSLKTFKDIASHCVDSGMKDMGLGLQLFFKTQEFLIVVAGVFFGGAFSWRWVMDRDRSHLFKLWSMASQQCAANDYAYQDDVEAAGARALYARNHVYLCIVAWLVVLMMTLTFHYRQRKFMRKYDRATQSAEDYTMKLSNLPHELTSEKKLKELLEEELRMNGKIYGVCIVYDILGLSEDDRTRIEEMVENVVESDDIKLGWTDPKHATDAAELERSLEEDRDHMQKMVTEKTLKGSGTAYVVFKKQADMVQVIHQRRGIDKSVFLERTTEGTSSRPNSEKVSPGYAWHSTPSRAVSQTLKSFGKTDVRKKNKLRKMQSNAEDSEGHIVTIEASEDEPAGIRFYDFTEVREVYLARRHVFMPLRMVLYIGIYGVAAHLFWWSMIKPFQDHGIEGAESSLPVKLTSKAVLMLNFAIQTAVMVDVEHGRHGRTSLVDRITFIWNTLLLLVTNGYVIAQQGYQEGIQWNLAPPSPVLQEQEWWRWLRLAFQSARIENQVGRNLVNVMTEQILLLYVIGEVANVLLPVAFYWIALRCIFVWDVGGSCVPWIRKALRGMLPRSMSETVVTAREAEKAQILMPLLLWMEYTYVVVFAAMGFTSFYVVTDQEVTMLGWFLIFSIVFHIWQRYVMLWLYGKATYDSAESYEAFILFWGVVVSMLPPAAVLWAGRLGWIQQVGCVVLIAVLVLLLVLLLYWISIKLIDNMLPNTDEEVDDFSGSADPGYSKVLEEQRASWWNVNPIYVLKQRHCPTAEGYEVHSDSEFEPGGPCCWPQSHRLKGYFEPGKQFRHEERDEWEEDHKQNLCMQLVTTITGFGGDSTKISIKSTESEKAAVRDITPSSAEPFSNGPKHAWTSALEENQIDPDGDGEESDDGDAVEDKAEDHVPAVAPCIPPALRQAVREEDCMPPEDVEFWQL